VASPYGYWDYNNGLNGLVGAPSTVEETPDGRPVLVKDPTLPAVLEDQFILNALSHSRQARKDFSRLFPTLDPVSQDRLADLILTNKRAASLVLSDQDFADAIQQQEVTSGVRVKLAPAIRV
jgi:hypothetical protein